MPRVEIRSKSDRGYRVLGMSHLFGAQFEEVEITDEQLAALAEEPSQFVEYRVIGKAQVEPEPQPSKKKLAHAHAPPALHLHGERDGCVR